MAIARRLTDPRTGALLWREFPRLPKLLLERSAVLTSRDPWMAAGAVNALNETLTKSDILLELGSGRSTIWYADRVAEVTSIEPDAAWADATKNACAGVKAVSVVNIPVGKFLATAELSRFNIAIVDHLDEPQWSRADSVQLLASRRSLDLIVLDDSERARYSSIDLGREWKTNRFTSLKSYPFSPAETTLFFRTS